MTWTRLWISIHRSNPCLGLINDTAVRMSKAPCRNLTIRGSKWVMCKIHERIFTTFNRKKMCNWKTTRGDITHTASVRFGSSASHKHTPASPHGLNHYLPWTYSSMLFHRTEQISGFEAIVINTMISLSRSTSPSASRLVLLIKRDLFKGQSEQYTVFN